MNWFYAIAGEQKGPVTPEQLDALLAQGVITPDTLVWREGLPAWQPLRSARPPESPAGIPPAPQPDPLGAPPEAAQAGVACVECGRRFGEDQVIRFGEQVVCAACKPRYLQRLAEGVQMPRRSGTATVATVLARDYAVDLGRLFERAWGLFKQRPGFMLGALALAYLLIFAASVIPIVSIVAPIFVQGPILGGLFLVYLRLLRGEHSDVGQLFDGFRKGYWQLVLVQFIQGLLTMAILMPVLLLFIPIVLAGGMFTPGGGFQAPSALTISLLVAVGFLTMAVGMVVGATWMFSVPLVADRGMAFWPAMELSRKVVWRHLGRIILFVLTLMLLNFAGMMLLCFGLLLTAPLSVMMVACLFDELFGDLAYQGT